MDAPANALRTNNPNMSAVETRNASRSVTFALDEQIAGAASNQLNDGSNLMDRDTSSPSSDSSSDGSSHHNDQSALIKNVSSTSGDTRRTMPTDSQDFVIVDGSVPVYDTLCLQDTQFSKTLEGSSSGNVLRLRLDTWYQSASNAKKFRALIMAISMGAAIAIVCYALSGVRHKTRKVERGSFGSLLSQGVQVFGLSVQSNLPTSSPSSMPSSSPSSSKPTSRPFTIVPTATNRSLSPSMIPSVFPTLGPSTDGPSPVPSTQPTLAPSTEFPSLIPSTWPTLAPATEFPTVHPTPLPSLSPANKPVIFYVVGDVPYTSSEARRLKKDMDRMPSDGRFLVHVGDIFKKKETDCTEDLYSDVKNILKRCNQPVFIIPGDNDVFDCRNDDDAWRYWQRHFLHLDKNWNHSLPVRRQADRKENFSIFLDGLLFVGVNIVAGGGGGGNEEKYRERDNAKWTLGNIIKHGKRADGVVIFAHYTPDKDFEKAIGKEIEKLGIPALYIHGNGHKWEYEKEAFGVKNMIRVQVDNGGSAPPVKVEFSPNAIKPFDFDRRR